LPEIEVTFLVSQSRSCGSRDKKSRKN